MRPKCSVSSRRKPPRRLNRVSQGHDLGAAVWLARLPLHGDCESRFAEASLCYEGRTWADPCPGVRSPCLAGSLRSSKTLLILVIMININRSRGARP